MNLLFLALGVLALVGLVCRLGALDWRIHKLLPLVTHAALALGLLLAMLDIVAGQMTVGQVGYILCTLLWLLLTWPAWHFGVPRAFIRSNPISFSFEKGR